MLLLLELSLIECFDWLSWVWLSSLVLSWIISTTPFNKWVLMWVLIDWVHCGLHQTQQLSSRCADVPINNNRLICEFWLIEFTVACTKHNNFHQDLQMCQPTTTDWFPLSCHMIFELQTRLMSWNRTAFKYAYLVLLTWISVVFWNDVLAKRANWPTVIGTFLGH